MQKSVTLPILVTRALVREQTLAQAQSPAIMTVTKKHKTEIGADAFIGSNSALVAPVKIGEGAYVGSGSVITKDVDKDSLAVARGRQAMIEGWGVRFRKANGDD